MDKKWDYWFLKKKDETPWKIISIKLYAPANGKLVSIDESFRSSNIFSKKLMGDWLAGIPNWRKNYFTSSCESIKCLSNHSMRVGILRWEWSRNFYFIWVFDTVSEWCDLLKNSCKEGDEVNEKYSVSTVD